MNKRIILIEGLTYWAFAILIIMAMVFYNIIGDFTKTIQLFLALGSIILFVVIMLTKDAFEEVSEQ